MDAPDWSVDAVVVGAGVVGLACAKALAEAGREVVVLEAEAEVAAARAEPDDDYPPTIADADAERVAEHALEVQQRADWRPEVQRFVEVRTASRGLSALVGGLAALALSAGAAPAVAAPAAAPAPPR